MGLGPHGSSLLQRLGRSTEPPELLEIVLDQSSRNEARKLARIRYGMKHKAKVKPLAPVEESSIKSTPEGKRCWVWIGEDIPSKALEQAGFYTSDYIRSMGFKLPKLKGKAKA
jgi:hypothetical protein